MIDDFGSYENAAAISKPADSAHIWFLECTADHWVPKPLDDESGQIRLDQYSREPLD